MSEPKGVAEYYDMTADDSEPESSVDCPFDGAVAPSCFTCSSDAHDRGCLLFFPMASRTTMDLRCEFPSSDAGDEQDVLGRRHDTRATGCQRQGHRW